MRPPQTRDIPEYVPGIITDYDTDTKKATIVAWRRGGMNITLHGVPYDENMTLETLMAGCWCYNPEDLSTKIPDELARSPEKSEAVTP